MAGRSLRMLPPAALLAGVLLFGLALLVLGVEAAEEEPRPLDPSSFTTANGTAMLAYPIKHYGLGSTRVEVEYAFPVAPGDAYVLHCEDVAAMGRGESPRDPLLSFTHLREGTFVVSKQTLPARPGLDEDTDPRSGLPRACALSIVFSWAAGPEDATENRPTVTVALREQAFDQGRYWVLLTIMAGGAVLALAGGLSWARTHQRTADLPGADESPIEMLRASLDRMGGQLESARRHLLYAGVLGVFLWYPVLVPWAWNRASRTSDSPLFPWAVSGLTLAFLLVLTLLWARELHRLDRELLAWRSRMGELREREAGLMETLEDGR